MERLLHFAFAACLVMLFGNNASGQQFEDPDQQQMMIAVDSALAALNRHDLDLCADWIVEADRISQPGFPKELLYHFYQTKGRWLNVTWQLREAEEAFLTAIALSTALSDSAKMVSSHSGLATTLAEQNRYHEAIRHQKLALSHMGPLDSLRYYGLLCNLAVSYNQAQLFDQSLSNYLKARRYFKQIQDYTRLAIVENNIGELYRERLNDLMRAREQYHRAIALNSKDNNTSHLVQNYHNLGLVHCQLQQYDSAFYYNRKSLSMRKAMGNIGGVAISWHALGELFVETNQLDSALWAFEKTLQISEEMGIPPGIYHSSIGIARVYDKRDMYRESESYLLDAMEVATDLKSLDFQSGVHERLHDLHKRNGRFKKALAAQEAFLMIQDSIKSTQNAHRLADLKTRYETDLAAAENKALRSQKALQSSKIIRQRWLMIFLGILLFTLTVAGAVLIWSNRQRKIAYRAEVEAKQELQEQYNIVKEHETPIARGQCTERSNICGVGSRFALAVG